MGTFWGLLTEVFELIAIVSRFGEWFGHCVIIFKVWMISKIWACFERIDWFIIVNMGTFWGFLS
jgi:hypothetical protein